MPGTPSLLAGPVVATAANNVVTGSISPTANSLILVLVGYHAGNEATSVTASFGTRQDGQGRVFKPTNNIWSDPETLNTTAYGSGSVKCQIYWGITSSSPGSGTITVNMNAFNSVIKVFVVEVTDVDIYNPIVQHHYNGTAANVSAQVANLPYTPSASNVLVSIGYGRGSTTTVAQDAGWTELGEDTTNSAPCNVQYIDNTTSSQFGVIFGQSMLDGITLGAVEVRGNLNGVPSPTVLTDFYLTTASQATQLLPETGSVSVNTGDLILIPTLAGPQGTGDTAVSSITSTFSVAAPGWQKAMNTTAVGTYNTRLEWWYAIANATGSGTATITYAAAFFGPKGGWILSIPSGTFNSGSPIGLTAQATTASITGPNHLTGSFSQAPASTSMLLAVGMGNPNSNQLWVNPRVGWNYIGPPIDEGGSQTSYVIFSSEHQTFGGNFGTTGQDSTSGAAWGAIEILAPSGAIPPYILVTVTG